MILRHAGSCWEALSSENEDLFHKREILMGRVTEQKTFKEAFKMAEDYVHEVFERCSSLNSSSGQKQAVLAMEYIRQHYNEPELGLNDICSYLNIGTSYFSTIFKEATGGTFLEFLSKTRMEKAKELLEQTALKNYEIAEKVGFSDPHYFGISFKKMTGKTPTEYAREKKIHMKKKSTDGSRHMYWNFDSYRRQQVFCSESEMPEAAVCDGHLYGVYRIW